MKRIWCIALAAVMLFTMVPAQVTSEDGSELKIVPVEEVELAPETASAATPTATPTIAPMLTISEIPEAELTVEEILDAPASESAAAVPTKKNTTTSATAVSASKEEKTSVDGTAVTEVEKVAEEVLDPSDGDMLAAENEPSAADQKSETKPETAPEKAPETDPEAAPEADPEKKPEAEPGEDPEAVPEVVFEDAGEEREDENHAGDDEGPVMVVEEPASRAQLSASVEETLTQTPFTVRFSAPGADEMALLADGAEIFHAAGGEENSVAETREEAGTVAYVLRARFGEDWEVTEAVCVRVTAPYGEIDQPSLDMPDRVEVGENVTISIEDVEHADHYVMQVFDGGSQMIAQYSQPASGSVVIPADALMEGEYRVDATVTGAGTTGDGSVSRSFTVKDAERQVTLTADKTQLPPGTSATLTLSAPNADSAVLYRQAEGKAEEQEAAWTENIPASYSVSSDETAVITYRLVARYGEEDVSSEPVTLTFASNTLAAPVLRVNPGTVKTGDDVVISVGRVENVTSYAYELTSPSGSKNSATKTTTEAFNIRIHTKSEKDGVTKYLAQGVYRMKVTAQADGYESSSAEVSFRVVKLTLETGVSEVPAGSKFTLTLTALNADAIELLRVESDSSTTVVKSWAAGGSFNAELTAEKEGTLTYTMRAKWGSDWFTGSTVTVKVTQGAEKTAVLTASATQIRVGEEFSLTAKAENADAIELLRAVGEEAAQSFKRWESGGAYTVELQPEEEGVLTYTVRAKYGEEWITGNSVTVTVEKALPTVALTVSPQTAETGTAVTVHADAPDADSYALYENDVQAGSEADGPDWTFTYGKPGTYAYRLETVYGKETVKAETTLTVTASKGKLSAPSLTVPETVGVSEASTLTFAAVDNAESYVLALYDADGAQLASEKVTKAGTYQIQALKVGVYRIIVTAQAAGYESAAAEKSFTVKLTAVLTASAEAVAVGEAFTLTVTAKAADALELLQVAEDESTQVVKSWAAGGSYTYEVTPEETGELTYTVRAKYGEEWVQGNTVAVTVNKAEVTVTLTAAPQTAETGAAVTVQAEAPEADSYILFVNDTQAGTDKDGPQWTFTYYSAGVYAYRLEATYGDETKTAEASVTVTASKGKLAAPEVTVPASVALSEDVRMSFAQVTNAEKYVLAVYNADDDLLARAEITKAGAYRLGSGSALGEGEYRLVVTAQAAGYDASVTEKRFTVASTVDQTVTLTSSKTAVTTMETYTLTAVSPNAQAMEVTGVNADGDNVYSHSWAAGGTQSVSVATGIAGKVTYTARARFGETWAESSAVTVQVTATKGDLGAPQTGCPYQAASGQAVKVTVAAVSGAQSYALRMVNVLTGETAASTVLTQAGDWQITLPDGHYRLEAAAQAAGYNAGVSVASLHVGAIDRTVAFTVASAAVQTGESIVLNINAPHADKLRLYVKENSGEEKLTDTFDYKPQYSFTYSTPATLTLRLEGQINSEWIKGNALTVRVTASKGQLGSATIDVASQIKKGDKLIFTVSKAENAARQTVKLSMKSGSAASTVYEGEAASKTFKIDTSRLPEGQYVITVISSAPGYIASTATAELTVGSMTASAATPTVTPKATGKVTATPKKTVKPTSTTKTTKQPSATKKTPSTPKAIVAVKTPTPTPTPTQMLQPLQTLGAAGSQNIFTEDGVLYREATNIQETYGLNMQSSISAQDAIKAIVNSLGSGNGRRIGISIAHVEDVLEEEEVILYLDLDAQGRICYMLGVLGLDGPVESFISKNPGAVNPEVRTLLIAEQQRKARMTEQARSAWDKTVRKYFGMPSTPSGEEVLCLELSIYTGSNVRLERIAFRKSGNSWYLYKIYIGTQVDES